MFVQVDLSKNTTIELEMVEDVYGEPSLCQATVTRKDALDFHNGLYPAMYLDRRGVMRRGEVDLWLDHFEVMGDMRIDYVFDVEWWGME